MMAIQAKPARKPAAKPNTPKRNGPPRIEFDLAEVESLASRGLSQEQIADSLGVSLRTIEARKADDAEFAAAMKRGRASMRKVLANGLFQQAEKGNLTALIFLSKIHLGWKEDQPAVPVMTPAQIAAALREEMAKADA